MNRKTIADLAAEAYPHNKHTRADALLGAAIEHARMGFAKGYQRGEKDAAPELGRLRAQLKDRDAELEQLRARVAELEGVTS